MIAWLLFGFGAFCSVLAANAWRPPRAPASLAIVVFFAGWLTTELAVQHVLVQATIVGVLFYLGGLGAWQGLLGLGLVVASSVSLLVIHARAARAETAFEHALRDAFGADHAMRIASVASEWTTSRIGAWPIVAPFLSHANGVARTRGVPFWSEGTTTLRLDVHAPRAKPTKAPTLVYVHGGGWVIGYRRYQGLPLMRHLASLGWVCFSVDYRLSPGATFPDHLVDVKRAIAWVREHAAEYGADPDFVVLAGNSAGAHLAALAALTANEPELQPGFESADTRVAGCLGFYGVYDFEDRFGHWPHKSFAGFVERTVVKARRAERPELFAQASPIARVHRDAPPFLLVHGDRDTLAPPEESRRFADALRAASGAPVVHVEIEGAQHAFEVFPSPRAAHAVHGSTRFLAWLYSRAMELRDRTR